MRYPNGNALKRAAFYGGVLGGLAGISLGIAALAVILGVFAGKGYPAYLQVGPDWRREPVMPGTETTSVQGCGFVAGVPVSITDSVTYVASPWFPIPSGFESWSAPIGSRASIQMNNIPVDSSGCIQAFWYQGWGIGKHELDAYQTVRNKQKQMTANVFDVAPHHPFLLFEDYCDSVSCRQTAFCYSYAPVLPTPYIAPKTDDNIPAAHVCSVPISNLPSVKLTYPQQTYPVQNLPPDTDVTLTADASAPVAFYTAGGNDENQLRCDISAPPYQCTFHTCNCAGSGYAIDAVAHNGTVWRATVVTVNVQ